MEEKAVIEHIRILRLWVISTPLSPSHLTLAMQSHTGTADAAYASRWCPSFSHRFLSIPHPFSSSPAWFPCPCSLTLNFQTSILLLCICSCYQWCPSNTVKCTLSSFLLPPLIILLLCHLAVVHKHELLSDSTFSKTINVPHHTFFSVLNLVGHRRMSWLLLIVLQIFLLGCNMWHPTIAISLSSGTTITLNPALQPCHTRPFLLWPLHS